MNKLRECRERLNLSQKQVAFEIGVKAPTVSQWESGIKLPSRDNIAKLADLYEVSTDYLMGRAEPNDEESHSITQFSQEEIKLIHNFRRLSFENKISIRNNILFLLSMQVEKKDKQTTIA